MTRAQATPVVHIDDERFRATEWRFDPGAETGWHVHEHDYVIVPWPMACSASRSRAAQRARRRSPATSRIPAGWGSSTT
jgi:hypothetical protein